MNASSIPAEQLRRIELHGAVNFRDLGGLVASDGGRIRRGLVFRSDHLARLTGVDHDRLARLPLRTVCDLRSDRERRRSPDLLPPDGSISYHVLPVEDARFDPATALERLQRGDRSWLSLDFVVGLYRRYLDDFASIWAAVLSLAADPDNLPLVFHCTGGKDRTGICAALLLRLLGVDEATILAEHELSTYCNAERVQPLFDKLAGFGVDATAASPYLEAPAEPLAALFEHLGNRYGTVEDYLLGRGGLSPALLNDLRILLRR